MKPFWSLPLILVFFHLGVFCSIGQSIRVTSAYYGSPNVAGVDVTRRVQQFADYGEPFRIGKETLRIDPSPHHRRSLVVIYEVNGQRISDCVPEGDVFYFRNNQEIGCKRADREAAIRIKDARYGAHGHYNDVTERVRVLVRDRASFTVSSKTFGINPNPGHRRWLTISYLRGGTRHNRRYAEGDEVRLK